MSALGKYLEIYEFYVENNNKDMRNCVKERQEENPAGVQRKTAKQREIFSVNYTKLKRNLC